MNIGYPNSFDKANKRDGSLIMIHGDCWSVGCFAMSDEQISEVYALARVVPWRTAVIPGPVLSVPHDAVEPGAASKQSEPGVSGRCSRSATITSRRRSLEPKVDVCDGRYVFDAQRPPDSSKPFVFNASRPCRPLSSIRKSQARRYRSSARTNSNTRDCLNANVPAGPDLQRTRRRNKSGVPRSVCVEKDAFKTDRPRSGSTPGRAADGRA